MNINVPNKYLYIGVIATAIVAVVGMYFEFKYQPVAITVDVAHYAADRIGKGPQQVTASAQPQATHLVKRTVSKAPSANTSNTAAPLPQIAGQHTVAKGETLWSIARTYEVLPKELLAANGMTRDTKLYPGQMVTIPSK